jgi:hypothetical protein
VRDKGIEQAICQRSYFTIRFYQLPTSHKHNSNSDSHHTSLGTSDKSPIFRWGRFVTCRFFRVLGRLKTCPTTFVGRVLLFVIFAPSI